MGERRSNRGPAPRSDQQILQNGEVMFLLGEIAHGWVQMAPETRMTLRAMVREDLALVGFGTGSVATLLPRGRRLLDVATGLVSAPLPE